MRCAAALVVLVATVLPPPVPMPAVGPPLPPIYQECVGNAHHSDICLGA